MATHRNFKHRVGPLRKLKLVANPIGDMPRVQLAISGMRREKGAAASKLPFPTGDSKPLKTMLGLNNADRQIARRVVLSGRFFSMWAK